MNIYVMLGLIGVGLLLWWWFRPVHDVKKAREFMARMERSEKKTIPRMPQRVRLNDEYHQPLTPHQTLDDGYYYKRPAQDQNSREDHCQSDLPHRSSSRLSMCDYSTPADGGSRGSDDSGGSSSSNSSSPSD